MTWPLQSQQKGKTPEQLDQDKKCPICSKTVKGSPVIDRMQQHLTQDHSIVQLAVWIRKKAKV